MFAEAADILATAAACVGLISLEKLFGTARFPKAAAVLSLTLGGFIAAFHFAGRPSKPLLFGLISGLFLRTVQLYVKRPAAQAAAVLSCFGLIGLLSLRPVTTASWLAAGIGYLAMTALTTRIDSALLRRIGLPACQE
jgi:hypothetical protein